MRTIKKSKIVRAPKHHAVKVYRGHRGNYERIIDIGSSLFEDEWPFPVALHEKDVHVPIEFEAR
jgi:hypothetical protein